MHELNKTINSILVKDEMKPSHRNIVKNHSDISKEEIKLVQIQTNKIVVNKWDNTNEESDEKSQDYSFYKDSGGDDNSIYYGISEDEEKYVEWLKRKKE